MERAGTASKEELLDLLISLEASLDALRRQYYALLPPAKDGIAYGATVEMKEFYELKMMPTVNQIAVAEKALYERFGEQRYATYRTQIPKVPKS